MANNVPFSGIWTTFDPYIIPYHNKDISGFILTYGLQIYQGVHKVIFLTPLCRSPISKGYSIAQGHSTVPPGCLKLLGTPRSQVLTNNH